MDKPNRVWVSGITCFKGNDKYLYVCVILDLLAESFFASMKREEIYRTQYHSQRQFMERIDAYIVFYNTRRPHSTLNYKTTDGFELLHAQRKVQTG